ncbi:acyl-CoA dehydrogenase [Diaphorobacter sp. HDW4A]|uniref:acyl-CoA dehydrogenase family protein n=1 Tax=Diaphorobacter sp. HDW4A TaxID=2714924 RepID=UPI0014081F51|nr:acyl-CoA dehydrogenase family protein [Diaphorobacter sp. HDW4A]QIL81138.1 acyl-CoA dehydrogenase [Diaphorobacter sp. HDW4A]
MIRDSKQIEQLLAQTRSFVREVAIPHEEQVEREDCIPEPVVDQMRAAGFFGWSIPEAYGGLGLTSEELCLANMELSQCAVAYRARCGTNTGIGTEGLIQDGTEAQKRELLPRLATGELTSCLAVTEPDAGSDLLGRLASTATRTANGYVLNGTKRFITNAPIADLFTVLARTGDASEGSRSTTSFLVMRGTKGLSTGIPHRKMGQEGSPVSEVYLNDCEVPESAILGGEPGRGFASVMKALNKQRINLASLCIGPAIRLLDEALAHSRKRQQFGKAIGEFQLVQAMLADCKVEIEAAKALILDTARKRDAGEDVTMEASMCKYYASEVAGRVADRVVQIFGGGGYCDDIGGSVPRLYRDVRLFRLYEGTSQIHQLNIAKHLLK